MPPVIVRGRSLKSDYGLAHSTQYHLIDEGLWPPPVHLGSRAVGWLEHEITAVITARAAGKSDDDIRELVAKLLAARKVAEHNALVVAGLATYADNDNHLFGAQPQSSHKAKV